MALIIPTLLESTLKKIQESKCKKLKMGSTAIYPQFISVFGSYGLQNNPSPPPTFLPPNPQTIDAASFPILALPAGLQSSEQSFPGGGQEGTNIVGVNGTSLICASGPPANGAQFYFLAANNFGGSDYPNNPGGQAVGAPSAQRIRIFGPAYGILATYSGPILTGSGLNFRQYASAVFTVILSGQFIDMVPNVAPYASSDDPTVTPISYQCPGPVFFFNITSAAQIPNTNFSANLPY